jgi:hypothetical protein
MDKITNYADLPTWAKNLYSQTKARAKKRENAFELTKDGYTAMVDDHCALTGIAFDTVKAEGRTRHHKRPYAPSIDRIDNSIGYTDSNVRIVCVAVNLAMNTWGEEVLFRIAANLVNTQRDQSKWRGLSARLPKNVRLSTLSVDGPTYSARAIYKGHRLYLGTYRTPEEASDAVKRTESGDLSVLYSPGASLNKRGPKRKPPVLL